MTTTRASVRRAIATVVEPTEPGPDAVGSRRSIIIERIAPELDGGRYPVKRVVGDRAAGDRRHLRRRPRPARRRDPHPCRRRAVLAPGADAPDRQRPLVRARGAAPQPRATPTRSRRGGTRSARGARDCARSSKPASQSRPRSRRGGCCWRRRFRRSEEAEAGDDTLRIRAALDSLKRARSQATRAAALVGEDLLAAVRRHPDLRFASRSPDLPLVVDRERAAVRRLVRALPALAGTRSRAARWRPPSRMPMWRLPGIAEMGFDVVYLPPIHPIGRTNRKGRNNSLDAGPDDVGVAVRHRLCRWWPRRGRSRAGRAERFSEIPGGG